MRSTRWLFLVGSIAVLAIAAPPTGCAFARGGGGGGGGSGGRKGGKAKGETDDLESMQRDDAAQSADAFRDDATREPLQLVRAADRVE